MMKRCTNCPGKSNLISYLKGLFEDEGYDTDNLVNFKYWTSEEKHTQLKDMSENCEDFIELLSNKLDKGTKHHFTAKAQAQYLKWLKENLSSDEAIILLDFAENFSFVVQDAVQGFHWNNDQATLHPFSVYSMVDGSLQCHSLCVISDERDHGAPTVHTFISKVLPYIKEIIPNLKKVYYYSDGAGSQYKNCKNFTNLSFHKDDFDVDAEWHFFATSHGKSPCDGIGGTVKRLVALESLRRPLQNQILSPQTEVSMCCREDKRNQIFLCNI
ncbi:MAG: hypothetical protein MK200_06480 [Nitrosopumilus sp.]|nr:hypothetical protein [Nitrosopumilus sp.]